MYLYYTILINFKMEQHPIQMFLDSLFPNKPAQKRNLWAQFLISQEYQSVEGMKQISDEVWKSMNDKIPLEISEEIKVKVKSYGQNTKNTQIQTNDPPKITQKDETNDPQKITQEDISKIAKLLNRQLPHQQIVELMEAQLDTPRGNAILDQIKMLIKPPKPFPEQGKKIIPKDLQNSLPLFHYVGKEDPMRKYYTFLVIGETGSGKTTLLDAFINKIAGIDFTDNWRYKLVDQSSMNSLPGGQSKTSEITIYYINDPQNRFNIKIIDTPGFEIKVDKITNKFQQLFSQIPEIDYILLTVKSTLTRLTPRSKYVYDCVQHLFGIDAKDRFILMCTFADGNQPLCLDSIGKDIHFDKYFTFNNSALYTSPNKSDATTKFFWKMAMESIENFYNYVRQTNKLPLSLKLSSQVLHIRKYLFQQIQTFQQSLNENQRLLDKAKMKFQQLQKNKQEIKRNSDYTTKEIRFKYVQTPLGKFIPVCIDCQVSCCQVCQWPQNSILSPCTYFNNGGNCPKCPGKCPRQRHARSDKLIKRVQYQEVVINDIKRKIQEKGFSVEQQYINQLTETKEKIYSLCQKIKNLKKKIEESLQKLFQIALKPKLFTDKQFYQLMIQEQQQQKSIGWSQKVAHLKLIISKKQIFQKSLTVENISQVQKELSKML